MNKVMKGLLIMGILGLAFCIGGYVGQVIFEPKVITIERVVTQTAKEPVERVVIKEVPMELREFASLQELEEWLEQDKTDATLYFTGEMDLSNPHSKNGYDCDDFAYRLQKSALAQGYLMSTEIIVENGEQHMINSTIIGNNIYFIEPRTDEVWLGAYRD